MSAKDLLSHLFRIALGVPILAAFAALLYGAAWALAQSDAILDLIFSRLQIEHVVYPIVAGGACYYAWLLGNVFLAIYRNAKRKTDT